MTRRDALRNVVVTLIGAVAVAAGFLSLASLPWWVTLIASVAVGALALLVDMVFCRPDQSARGRRTTLGVLGAVVSVSALVCAFALGRYTQGDPGSYPFVVTGLGVVVFIKAAPTERAQTDRILSFGTPVEIDCMLVVDDTRWYRLLGSGGWLSEDDALAAPHSGEGSPPGCPG